MAARPTTTTRVRARVRVHAYAPALVALVLGLLLTLPAAAFAAPRPTPSDRVFADLSDDDRIGSRDRGVLHAAVANPTFDQYRGNDPDVTATCPGALACDVRADLTDAGPLAPARRDGSPPAPAGATGLLALAPLAAIIAAALLAAGVAGRAVARTARGIPAFAAVAYVVLVVLGTRPLDLLGGTYPSQRSLELLEVSALAIVVVAVIGARRDALGRAWQVTAPLRHPSILLLAAFVSLALASRSWTASVDNADLTLGSMVGGLAVVASLAIIAARSHRVAAATLATFALAAGPLALLAGWLLPPVEGRMAGVPGDPNLLGMGFAAAAGIATSALVLRQGPRALLRLALLVAASSIVGIGATQSRGAVVALTAALIVTWIVTRSRRALGIGAAAVLATGCALLASSMVATEPTGSALARTAAGDATSGRLDTWSNALRQVAGNPIDGVGIGGFIVSIDEYRTAGDQSLVQAAHNTPLQVAAELGLPGLALGVAALLALALPLWRRARSGDVLAACWLAAGASLASSSMLLTTYAEPAAWTILAIGCAILATSRGAAAATAADEGDPLAPIVTLDAHRRPATTADDADRRTDAA